MTKWDRVTEFEIDKSFYLSKNFVKMKIYK